MQSVIFIGIILNNISFGSNTYKFLVLRYRIFKEMMLILLPLICLNTMFIVFYLLSLLALCSHCLWSCQRDLHCNTSIGNKLKYDYYSSIHFSNSTIYECYTQYIHVIINPYLDITATIVLENIEDAKLVSHPLICLGLFSFWIFSILIGIILSYLWIKGESMFP